MEISGLEYGEKSKYFFWSLFLIQSAVFIQTYKNWAFLGSWPTRFYAVLLAGCFTQVSILALNRNSGCHLSGIETINCFLELVNWSSLHPASAIDHPLRPVIHIDRALKITRQPHFPCMWFCSTGISFHWSLVIWAVTLLCSIHLKACVFLVTPPYCLTVARRQLRVGGSSR